MAEFRPNQSVETTEPIVEVTVDPQSPLPVGRVRFQLVVTDDSGNESAPDAVDVIIRDNELPTAILDAPDVVDFRTSFSLSGRRSSDVGGRIVSYRWALIDAPERPNNPDRPIVIERPVIERPVIEGPTIDRPIVNPTDG